MIGFVLADSTDCIRTSMREADSIIVFKMFLILI